MKEDLEGEIWKDVVGYEGYYKVSNMGRIYSMPKEWIGFNSSKGSHKGIILKSGISSNGYKTVMLKVKGVNKSMLVHQLVAESFLNHKPNGMSLVVDHVNDNKLDNRLENLQIVTTRFNSRKTQGSGSSKYKGVSFVKKRNKWVASITVNGKQVFLGHHDCELKAALEYQKYLSKL